MIDKTSREGGIGVRDSENEWIEVIDKTFICARNGGIGVR